MKKLLLLLLVLGSTGIYAQGYLHRDHQKIVDGNGKNIILRGIGLGGHMLQEGYMMRVPFSGQQHVLKAHIEELVGEQATNDFYKAWLHNHTQKIDVDSLKSWGFNSIRLPMHYNLFTLPIEDEPVKGKDTWVETGFQMVDSLLSWCKANHMYLILDMHAAPGGQGHDLNISDRDDSKPSLWESAENQRKMIALWKELASRYANEPWIGAYDIINEPNWAFGDGNKNGLDEKGNEPLKKLMVNITHAIREVDQNHMVIIEGNGWGNNYNGIFPVWDDNMAVSFHKYWNNNTEGDIQRFLDIRKENDVPIWLGESGENSNVWFTEAIGLMESHNIGWCWWPLKKLGFNNPLQIKVNPGYQKLLDFWADKGPKPTKAEAISALMQLAENAKLQNNIYHKDVVDAMIRQPHTTASKPFKKVSVPAQKEIQAVDYDMGQIGYAYFDTVAGNYYISNGGTRATGNNGHTYRNDGVDIYETANDGLYVGDMESGEWLTYTFTVETAGKYNISFKLRAVSGTAQASLQINGNKAGSFPIKETNGAWELATLKNISLQQGHNTIRIAVDSGTPEFKSIQFEAQ